MSSLAGRVELERRSTTEPGFAVWLAGWRDRPGIEIFVASDYTHVVIIDAAESGRREAPDVPTLKQVVEAEQAEHDASTATDDTATDAVEPEQPVDEQGNPTIVDRSQYEREDLAVDKVDGNAIDKLRLSFAGTIMLDRSEPADVALWNRLRLGKGEVALRVEGVCTATGAKQATNRDGDLDVIVGAKTLSIRTLYVPVIGDDDGDLDGTVGRTSTEPDDGGE